MTDEQRLGPATEAPDSDAAPTLPDLSPAEASSADPRRSSPSASEVANGPLAKAAEVGEAALAGRRRNRMALRIPDDEVVRPQAPVPVVREPADVPDYTSPSGDLGAPIRPARIITINPPPPTPSPADQAPAIEPASTTQGPLLQLDDDDALTPRMPSVASPARESQADREDSPQSDLSAEDLVSVDFTPSPPPASLPAAVPRVPPQPPASLPPKKVAQSPAAPTQRPSKPPLVIVPPHMGSVAPQPPEALGPRRKGRLWWEELFNDDYIRASERLSDEQLGSEVDFIEQSLGIERGGAVLDLACGTGRYAVELARRGYQVVGFDLSLAMLARASDEAQERAAQLNFVQGDMREMTFAEQFDGVFCWNTSFGFFEEGKNAVVIDRIHAALKGGGQLLLDVVNRDFVVPQSPSLAWFEGDGCVCMDEMIMDFITSRMRVKRTMMLDDGRTREIEYSMRVYSLHELGKMLHEHGFKVCEVSGRTTTPGVFLGHDSPRTIILAERR
jgi:SAM-dependent methyltransferase